MKRIIEIATPQPAGALKREIEELGYEPHEVLLTPWASDLESVIMFGLNDAEVRVLKRELGDVLVFERMISNRIEL